MVCHFFSLGLKLFCHSISRILRFGQLDIFQSSWEVWSNSFIFFFFLHVLIASMFFSILDTFSHWFSPWESPQSFSWDWLTHSPGFLFLSSIHCLAEFGSMLLLWLCVDVFPLWCPMTMKEDIRCPRARITDDCEVPYGWWELNPSPLEAQLVL